MESLPDEADSSPDEAESSPDEAKSSPHEMENLPKRRTLPYDIDGLKVYSLEYDSGNKTAVTEDGRQWSNYTTSRRAGFVGKRYLKSCKGSYRCENQRCGYFRQYNKVNQVQFEKKESCLVCRTCGATPVFVPCFARKIWEYPEGKSEVTVYHYGIHTCFPVKRSPTTVTDTATMAFKQSRTLKPERFVNDKLIEATENEESLEAINDLADSLVERQTLKKMKQSAKEKLDPVGHSYDAVMKYKTKVQDVLKDPFLIFKVDCEKQIVFKTSREQLQLAMEMGQGHLNVEPCHVDGKHNRVTGYITISLVVYNPNLREMMKIATMECPTESKENIGIFWDCLNTALRQFTGDNKYFLSLILLKASTKNMYDKAKAALEKFIDNNPFLNNWWKWWEARRSHVFRAFKPGFNVAKSNLAEVHHSRSHHIGAENLTLIQACREDVAESVKLKRRVEDQKKQAEAFCKELDDYVEKGEDLQLREPEYFVDETAAHRNDPLEKRPCKKTSACASTNKKCEVDKRLAPRQNTRSTKFSRSLQIAKSCQNSYRVGDIKFNSPQSHEISIIHNTGTSYKVALNKMPSCDGCKYCSSREICSHILWVLLYVYKVPENSEVLQQRSFLNSELESITKGRDGKAPTSKTLSATTINTATATAANTPTTTMAAKDFRNPDLTKQQWCISRVVSRGRTPACSGRNCSRQFERGDLSIQVSAHWIPPHETKDGKKFTVDRNYHFCLQWSCLQNIPANSNLQVPPSAIKLDEIIGPSLSSQDYDKILSENLPVQWLK
ncbi:Hypothetical predicted protein [Paramuricea clavata]|uniref:Uncharacterized protein n=1 Tax=Paramuricea clavata TaxID=317549 RepID=A0A6S7FTJ9_PARCT|nr:Hypothetical predicted protein [Paramuricea clavata]